jgi:hypothetical protein
MGELVHAQPTAGAARALGIVEDEIAGPDLSVDEMVRGAAQGAIEPVGLGPAGACDEVDLQETIAADQRR